MEEGNTVEPPSSALQREPRKSSRGELPSQVQEGAEPPPHIMEDPPSPPAPHNWAPVSLSPGIREFEDYALPTQDQSAQMRHPLTQPEDVPPEKSLVEDHESEHPSSKKCYDEEVGTENNQMNMSLDLSENSQMNTSFDSSDDSKISTEQRTSSKIESTEVPSRRGSELVEVNLASHRPQPMKASTTHENATEELMVRGLITLVPPLSQRAEIDTAAPFESVKAAVSLFGERVDWKSQQRAPQQPQVSRLELSEANKVQEDLVCCKEQLALTQASSAGVLLELKKIKRLIEKSAGTRDVMDVTEVPEKVTRAVTRGRKTTDLETIWKEIESVKKKLVSVKDAEELAGKGLQEAHIGLKAVLKRVNELAGEQTSLDEALTAAHLTLADAEEQVAMLRSGHKVDLLESVPSDSMEKKNEEIKGLERKWEEANALIVKQSEELVATKKAESYAAAVAAEKHWELERAKLQLDQAKTKELSMVGKVARILEESDELKGKLERTVQFIATRGARVGMLDTEKEQTCSVLDSMHQEEQAACATLASLQGELQEAKEALVIAQVGEARAVHARERLPAAIKEAAYEADEAKAAAEASKEEVRKARQGIEEAKAAASTAMSRHQAALKEIEAARASEAMALAELKVLTESEARGGDTEDKAEGVMGVAIPLEEYSALKRAGVEAEGMADNKVAEAVAQVEEAKASQIRAQSKLDDALKEAEKGKDELTKAQYQVDDAQEAKLTAEGELRKWRAEHDPRRKSVLDPTMGASQVSPPKHGITNEETIRAIAQDMNIPPVVQGKKVAGRDSLAQVMSLKLPAPEGHHKVPPAEDLKKQDRLQRSIMRRLVSLVLVKKKT